MISNDLIFDILARAVENPSTRAIKIDIIAKKIVIKVAFSNVGKDSIIIDKFMKFPPISLSCNLKIYLEREFLLN